MSGISNRQPDANRRTGQLTDAERHELLANERRRSVLAVLDCETASSTPDQEAARSVRVSLHHVHLPKMTALGVVDYDPATRRIES